MATSGPPSANTKPVKEKKELTDEQKKMYGMLGFMGFLAVVTAAIYIPPMLKSSPTADLQAQQTAAVSAANEVTTEPGAPPNTPPLTTPGAPPVPTGEGATPPAGGAPPAVAATGPVGVQSVIRHRPDPFQPFYSTVLNPEPTPTPIPPVQIPAPNPAVILPPVSGQGGRLISAESRPLSVLPPIRISTLHNHAVVPQTQTAFKRIVGPGGSSSWETAEPSYNKRLSGVIIGDGIRALLEINDGEQIVTRVVQPGDEVDGISIVSIQRVTEGNRPVTRMLIRENNQERYVDLKAAPQRTTTEGGPGAPGAPGMP